MESATLTRPRPGSPPIDLRRLAALPWPAICLAALCLVLFVGYFVFPVYPNYDSYYSLLWGRELLHFQTPSFEAYRAATEHPLAIAFGALMSLFGRGGDRLMVACTLVSFVALAMGLYRLGRATFTPLVGLIAGAILCSRFDFVLLAARAYIDIPYLAIIVWAGALEVEKPRRGGIVWLLLVLASLMRPEAWVITGLYWLWVFRDTSWNRRIRTAIYTAAGPLIWVALDAAVTGHPLFSLQHTNGLAEELGRTKGLSQVPQATWDFLDKLDKIPVLWGAIVGIGLATWIAPRRVVMPLALLLTGIVTFFAVGVAGLSIIDRYLLVPSLMVMILAGVTLGGWTMLVPGSRVRTIWMVLAAAMVIYGVVFTVTRVRVNSIVANLYYRGDSHHALTNLLDMKVVRAAEHCGPVSVPNHKHIPDTRWILGAGVNDVIARSAVVRSNETTGITTIDHYVQRQINRGGVAIYEKNRTALFSDVLIAPSQDPDLTTVQSVPQKGYHRIAANAYFAAYVHC